MENQRSFLGKVITGQVLTEGYIIDWNSELNKKLYHRDLIIKKGHEVTPTVKHEKWKKNISKIEIVNEISAKNVKDSIIRGTVGSVALGAVGGIAGVLSAKSDTTFNVIITYHDNQIDLIECDVELYTKLLQQANENNEKGITEYEDIYFSEEEKKKNDDEWIKANDQGYFGCGCLSLYATIILIAVLIWILIKY
ncbi:MULTISPECIES: hypothetical protein [Bacillus]|uniref:Uncharacterized protein n=1 Tax=Bacillus sonorensis TaxID=119858 RepID=A0ABM6LGI3_9BACI|nr:MULTISPECIES: hypothetical protein [Bacillus]ASB88410.1 hypothetical protein S101395_01902 [Bacillus sonorensis]NWN81133.1 hypothetical protein [Bacillus sp. (in: firmicutes)]RHJ05892.1 hypothetical protein DW143_21330 [Bacillus sonorensis]GIN67655.1 hypothetical protein J41TS2_30760 [Bacillus sonorensis]